MASIKDLFKNININPDFIQGLGTPIVVLAALAMVILPMPAFLLDILFSFNIALAIVVLLVAVYSKRPLDFASFPTVLLIATLLRLALNVASTRIVLLEGHKGGAAAGNVIEAFGSVVIGGNYAVGLIVFMILMIINFVVVTKGAGRISEVSARFTLDAMPGKQMAIDADLNAGIIDQDKARERRKEVTMEADFYGSMDGASKFVKGDAVAGLLILIINILGGFAVGMAQYDLAFGEAVEIYTLLSIGDGLVAQIPSLLLSIGSALIVTRENNDSGMGAQVRKQMLGQPKVLMISGAILFVMGIVPGMPHFAFLLFAGLCGGMGYYIEKQSKTEKSTNSISINGKQVSKSNAGTNNKANPDADHNRDLNWDDVQPVDVIGLEVGYRLIPLVDKKQGGELLARIKGVRKKMSQDLGFLVPAVHIRDNLDLGPNQYRITLMGVTFGESEVHYDKDMAINPGTVFGELEGPDTIDPAFGLQAKWIGTNQRENAQTLGYTVVDSSTVIATHLSQILTNQAAYLLGHEEVQNLLNVLGKKSPKLVESLIPDTMNLSLVVKVLQNLLIEGVPIRDIRSIVQTLVEYGPRSQDPDVLTAACRITLKRLVTQELIGSESEVPVITLSPDLEHILHQSLQATGGDGAGMEPSLADKLQGSLTEASQNQELIGQPAILLTSGVLRASLSRFVRNAIPNLKVLSYQEIPEDKQIRIVSSVGQ